MNKVVAFSAEEGQPLQKNTVVVMEGGEQRTLTISELSEALAAVEGKRWYQSKTLWLNAAIAALTAFEANVGMLREALGVNSYIVVVAVVAAANAGLRFATSQPITGQ